jgi:hypothetical protein
VVSASGSITASRQPGGAPRLELAFNVEIRPSTTIDVRAGGVVSNIDVAMQATAQLSGRILDDRGRGLAGASVQLVATRPGLLDPAPRVAFARSESDGSYRLTAPPGDYVVRAYIGSTVRPSNDPALAYIATFYPGVSSQEEAHVIRLAGVDQYDVDVPLVSARTVRVSGALVDPLGHSLEDVRAALRAVRSAAEGTVQLELNALGEFVARDVVPGTYAVDVTDPRRPERWKGPRRPLEITEDVVGLEIHAVAPAAVTGRVVIDPRSAGELNLTQTVISFMNRTEGLGAGMIAFNLNEDGSFHGEIPPGRMTLTVMGPAGWSPRAIRFDGVDVFGSPLEVAPGAHEIELVITDRLSSISGVVVDRRGTPLGGFDVVLFSEDEGRWHSMSPFIRQTRSHQNGQFELPLLPPGDYLAVATEGVPMILLGDPVPTLRELQSIGTRLKVLDGEQKTISIRASPTPKALVRFRP